MVSGTLTNAGSFSMAGVRSQQLSTSRPDLYEKLDLSSKENQKLLKELEEEQSDGTAVERDR